MHTQHSADPSLIRSRLSALTVLVYSPLVLAAAAILCACSLNMEPASSACVIALQDLCNVSTRDLTRREAQP